MGEFLNWLKYRAPQPERQVSVLQGSRQFTSCVRNGYVKQPKDRKERKRQLAAAAEALLPDYAAGGELTIFTTLDSEDFRA